MLHELDMYVSLYISMTENNSDFSLLTNMRGVVSVELYCHVEIEILLWGILRAITVGPT